MARIRSIHPGLFTDEAFMSVSAHARILLIGIWTEAWDDGVFEWKPLTLKARIFPVDAVDVGALLEELAAVNVVLPVTIDGKPYGLVRNFQRFQRPKKPNSSRLLPPEYGTYVGSAARIGEPVPNQLPTGTEKSPQMEDGGWREGGKKERSGAIAPSDEPSAEERFWSRLDDLERRGISRGQCVKLAKLLDHDFIEANRILDATEAALKPGGYLGGTIKRLQQEAAPVGAAASNPQVPPWVGEKRVNGVTVERVGKRWRCQGETLNDAGEVVGF